MNEGQYLVRTIDSLASASEAYFGLSLSSYSGLASSWTINWGDGTTDTYDYLGYSYTAFHMYDSVSSTTYYAVDVTFTSSTGTSTTFEGAARFQVDPENAADSQDALDLEDALDVFLTDDFVKDAFDL